MSSLKIVADDHIGDAGIKTTVDECIAENLDCLELAKELFPHSDMYNIFGNTTRLLRSFDVI